MNERIRKLAEQSYEATTVTTIDPVTQEVVVDFIDGTKPFFNQEKFAELLFNEIANTTVVSDGMFNGNERRLSVELRLGDMVKKISVFGVEE